MTQPFLQAVACVFLAVILGLVLGKTSKESMILLSVLVICMVGGLAIRYLEPVVELVHRLRKAAGLDGELLGILLKAVGIGLLGELSSLICNDAGNAGLGKGLQFLSVGLILCLSVPVLEALLELVTDILGEI